MSISIAALRVDVACLARIEGLSERGEREGGDERRLPKVEEIAIIRIYGAEKRFM